MVYGKGEELLEPSPARMEPDCSAYPRCGGCALRHMSYEEEYAMKLQRVNDALQRIGGLELAAERILPAGPDARERRKVIFNIGSLDGHPVGGFYRARSHEIVPVSECPAVPRASLRALEAVLAWLEEGHIPAYDEAAGIDGVRHLFYRSSHKTENAVVTLVVSRAPGKSAIRKLTDLLRARCPEMTGLEFLEEEHIYLLDGVQIPSVSKLMEPLSQHEYMKIDKMTLLAACLKYGMEDIDPEYGSYLEAFKEWRDEVKPEPVGSEVRVYHKLSRYAGTADLIAVVGGKLTLIDYKTSYKLAEKNVRVQLEAYSQALASHGIIIEGKTALHLTKDGKWKAHDFPARDAEALRVFNSLKCLYDYLAV